MENLSAVFNKYKGFITNRSKKTHRLVNHVNNINLQLSPQQLNFCCCQSVGKQREHNEDSVFALSSTFGGENGNSLFGLFIVADGMGGHQFGEVASATAVQVVAGFLLSKFHSNLHQSIDGSEFSSLEMMRTAFKEAQNAVFSSAPGSGTTLTAALVIGDQTIIGHVGDSRAYLVDETGCLESITRDHTLVRRLEELGQITPDEALTHPQRNILYQAIGQGDNLESDIFSIKLPKPGYLILCSDGLWGVVSNEKMKQIIVNSVTLQDACQELVSAANSAGGPDNISVIMIQQVG